jgi:hypothetical protein
MAWLTCARALPGLRLYVETADGISAELDVHAFIAGLNELRDPALFERVSISELGELSWPNGDVIGPDSVAAMLTAGRPYAQILSGRGQT